MNPSDENKVETKNLINWGMKHKDDVEGIFNSGQIIAGHVENMITDFPTGELFSILSADTQKDMVAKAFGDRFKNLPPGTFKKLFDMLLPMIINLILKK